MKNMMIKVIIVFLVFFTGTASLIALDGICEESTGKGGKLVLDIDNMGLFQ